MGIKIREARREDAPLIGMVVAMAIGMDGAKDYAGQEALEVLTEVASLEHSQYSYRNSLIAEVEGAAVGAIVGYAGADLKSLRDGSLSVILKYHPDLKVLTDETSADEFYLDSIGVLQQYRGLGIGSMLIDAMIKKAQGAGHRRFGLLVDFNNPDAERLYRSLGFEYRGNTDFFGHQMKHLQLDT